MDMKLDAYYANPFHFMPFCGSASDARVPLKLQRGQLALVFLEYFYILNIINKPSFAFVVLKFRM